MYQVYSPIVRSPLAAKSFDFLKSGDRNMTAVIAGCKDK